MFGNQAVRHFQHDQHQYAAVDHSLERCHIAMELLRDGEKPNHLPEENHGESTQNKGIIPDILFPEIYDATKIGESALPNSLVWDRIDKTRYAPLMDISAAIERLGKLHQERIKNDPGFKYIYTGIAQLEKNRSKKTISLKESVRKKEREEAENLRLELENMRRSIMGETLLTNVSELEEIDEDEIPDPDDPKNKFDPMLTETEQIFVDYLSDSLKMIAGH